jgi:hypothetical protein
MGRWGDGGSIYSFLIVNWYSFGQHINFNKNDKGNNLIGNGDNSPFQGKNGVNGDIVGTTVNPINPKLGPLQNNGGPTHTLALLPGSPAIDAGNNVLIPPGITTDQRGFQRIVNGRVGLCVA